jgi:hypothetical protein
MTISWSSFIFVSKADRKINSSCRILQDEGEIGMVAKIQILFVAAVSMLIAVPAGAGPDVQEGSWEITTVTKMKGMAPMPPQKFTQCLKGDDIVPVDPATPQNCVVKDQRVDGNTVHWTMECSSSGVRTVTTGTATYSGSRFSGTMDVVVEGMNMKLTSSLSGRRLGPCK